MLSWVGFGDNLRLQRGIIWPPKPQNIFLTIIIISYALKVLGTILCVVLKGDTNIFRIHLYAFKVVENLELTTCVSLYSAPKHYNTRRTTYKVELQVE